MHSQVAFFFSGLDEDFRITLIVGATADLALLYEKFEAVIAHCAILDLGFLALPKFSGRYGSAKHGRPSPIISLMLSSMQAAPKLRRLLSSALTAQSLFLPFRNTEKFEPMTTVSGLRLSEGALCEGLVKIGRNRGRAGPLE